MANRFQSLDCTRCGETYPPDTHSRCLKCGGIMDARYDLDGGFPSKFGRESIWDFSEFLPTVSRENVVSLGEGWTPYLESANLAEKLGLNHLWCKVEGTNPTGSFKDRAASLGLSLAREWRKTGVFTASDGNAAASVSAYAARAHMKCMVAVNEDASVSKLTQILMYSPYLVRVPGMYGSLASLDSALSQMGKALSDWMNLFFWAPYNPFVVDAFKTVAYEIALAGEAPGLVFVPVAGGDLLYGLYKGFTELHTMGRLEKIPRLVAVQAEGADPSVRAVEQHLDTVPEIGPASTTIASALRVSFGAEHLIKAVRETGGFGISVPDELILESQRNLARYEGIFCEISSAAALAAIKSSVDAGRVAKDETVAAVLTGFGLKEYPALQENVSKIPSAAPADLSRVLEEMLHPRP